MVARDLQRRVEATARDPAAGPRLQHDPLAQCISQPPSTLNAAPVMFCARSEARNAAISPMSVGVWKRWSGIRDMNQSHVCCSSWPMSALNWVTTAEWRSVTRIPGWIELTVMLCGANSWAMDWVIPVTANLDAT